MTTTATPTPDLIDAMNKVLACPAGPMFSAILDYLLDAAEPRTNPQVTQLAVTSDGFLMAWNTSNPFKEGFVGSVSDFEGNVLGICSHVGLSTELAEAVLAQAYTKINDWRTTGRRGANPYERKG